MSSDLRTASDQRASWRPAYFYFWHAVEGTEDFRKTKLRGGEKDAMLALLGRYFDDITNGSYPVEQADFQCAYCSGNLNDQTVHWIYVTAYVAKDAKRRWRALACDDCWATAQPTVA